MKDKCQRAHRHQAQGQGHQAQGVDTTQGIKKQPSTAFLGGHTGSGRIRLEHQLPHGTTDRLGHGVHARVINNYRHEIGLAAL